MAQGPSTIAEKKGRLAEEAREADLDAELEQYEKARAGKDEGMHALGLHPPPPPPPPICLSRLLRLQKTTKKTTKKVKERTTRLKKKLLRHKLFFPELQTTAALLCPDFVLGSLHPVRGNELVRHS